MTRSRILSPRKKKQSKYRNPRRNKGRIAASPFLFRSGAIIKARCLVPLRREATGVASSTSPPTISPSPRVSRCGRAGGRTARPGSAYNQPPTLFARSTVCNRKHRFKPTGMCSRRYICARARAKLRRRTTNFEEYGYRRFPERAVVVRGVLPSRGSLLFHPRITFLPAK